MRTMKEIRQTNRYRLVKRYARIGKLEELGKRLKAAGIATGEEFEAVAEEWIAELDRIYGEPDERPRWEHTDEERNALMKKLDHPDAHVQCPRCGNEIVHRIAGNSVAAECKTPGCIYTAIRGL